MKHKTDQLMLFNFVHMAVTLNFYQKISGPNIKTDQVFGGFCTFGGHFDLDENKYPAQNVTTDQPQLVC